METHILENVLVINLPECKDRWSALERELQKIPDVTYTRIPGIVINEGATLQDREAGCRAAHKNAIMYAKAKGWDHVLIFEDDVELHTNFLNSIPTIDKFLNFRKNWELFYLGGTTIGQSTKKTEHANILCTRHTATTSSYAIHSNCYDNIIALSNKQKPLDDLLRLEIQNRGRSFLINPPVCSQRAMTSVIQNKFTNYDFMKKTVIPGD